MKNRIYLITLFIIMGLSSASHAEKTTSENEKLAVAAANDWLKIVDADEYENSWTNAASFFKEKITSSGWKKAVSEVRKPLGKLVSRKMKSSTYSTQLPGAPKGEYVVIQFETSFENKKSGIETITPMLDKDKKWRVSGYFIK